MSLGNRYATHSFAQIPSVNTPRSMFDRSFAVKDTFDFDYLVPIIADEVLPGDTINLRLQAFCRLATQKVPIMDNMYIDYFFFFVPNRLVWNNWEKFNGAQDNPDDSTDYLTPTIQWEMAEPCPSGSLADKFGLPTQVALGAGEYLSVVSFPFRSYNLIFNTWFRDQNLQDSVVVDKDNGPDDPDDYVLLKRGKRHDYFTSCLPWPQKGGAAEILLDEFYQVRSTTDTTGYNLAVQLPDNSYRWMGAGGAEVTLAAGTGAQSQSLGVNVEFGITVNQLREAFMVQSLLELDSRGGTRYVEILKAHFNVISPDFRLQRPEYLGGGRTYINSHPVAQTVPVSGGSPQGTLAAFGTASADGIGFSKSFVEHGWIIGLACARADITYQQGVDRKWSRRTRYDYFWPKLQEMGEQPVLQREIWFSPSNATEIFGYQERYAEYRYCRSEIRGLFRSSAAAPYTSLDQWHLAEEFQSAPVLNDEFIEQSTPIERALAVTNEPHLLADYFFNYKHARPMMTYGVPATIGRF